MPHRGVAGERVQALRLHITRLKAELATLCFEVGQLTAARE
jgi:hypothetical protein